MHKPIGGAALACAAIGLAFAASAGGADATNTFTCRGSAARVTTTGTPPVANVEPIRANAVGTPCSSQSAFAVQKTTIGPITVEAANAFSSLGTSTAPGAGSLASVTQPDIVLGGVHVHADALVADASVSCDGDTAVPVGHSRVVGLQVNGTTITVPMGDKPFTLNLSPLVKLELNKETSAGGTLTRQALVLTTPVGTAVVAEAIAGAQSDSCASLRSGGGTTGTFPSPCPKGSTFDTAKGVCVIVEKNAQGKVTRTIVVGKPFAGPSGGTEIPLTTARKRYHSPCLSGPGPSYVIVGTNHADHITGTNGADRILLLGGNDKAEGGRGNDCIDGGTGNDTLSGALGDDRLYGQSGNDHLIGASNNDYLDAGSGRDTVNAGYGRDTVIGGPGRKAINVATAGPAATVHCTAGGPLYKIRKNPNDRLVNCGQAVVIVLQKVSK